MAQMAIFAAYPEMKIGKDIAMPIMRQFIKKVIKAVKSQINLKFISRDHLDLQIGQPSTISNFWLRVRLRV